MSEYVPSDQAVRASYRLYMERSGIEDADAEFDRFLAKVKRTAAREALDGAAAYIDSRVSWLAGTEVHSPRAQDVLYYRDTHYPEGDDQ